MKVFPVYLFPLVKVLVKNCIGHFGSNSKGATDKLEKTRLEDPICLTLFPGRFGGKQPPTHTQERPQAPLSQESLRSGEGTRPIPRKDLEHHTLRRVLEGHRHPRITAGVLA